MGDRESNARVGAVMRMQRPPLAYLLLCTANLYIKNDLVRFLFRGDSVGLSVYPVPMSVACA